MISLIFSKNLTIKAQETLNNQSIISLSQAKISKELIIDKIKASKCQFAMNTSGMIELAKASVKDQVIIEMMLATSHMPIMRNQDIIDLTQVQISKNVIKKKIDLSDCTFNTTTDGLIELKQRKISESLIEYILTKQPYNATISEKETQNKTVKNQPPTKVINKKETESKQDLSKNKESNEFSKTFSASEAKKNYKETKMEDSQKRVSPITCNNFFDNFTKKPIKSAEVTLRGFKPGASLLGSLAGAIGIEDAEVKMFLIKEQNDFLLCVYVFKPGSNVMLVNRDKPFYLMFTDDSVIEFFPSENSETNFNLGSSINTEMVVYYSMPKVNAVLLSKKLVKSYRINMYNKNYIEDTVLEKRGLQLNLAAKCIIE